MIQESSFGSAVCKIATILSAPQCVWQFIQVDREAKKTGRQSNYDVMILTHFPLPFMRGIHRSRMDFPHAGPLLRSFDEIFVLTWTDLLNKHSIIWWNETPYHSCDVTDFTTGKLLCVFLYHHWLCWWLSQWLVSTIPCEIWRITWRPVCLSKIATCLYYLPLINTGLAHIAIWYPLRLCSFCTMITSMS